MEGVINIITKSDPINEIIYGYDSDATTYANFSIANKIKGWDLSFVSHAEHAAKGDGAKIQSVTVDDELVPKNIWKKNTSFRAKAKNKLFTLSAFYGHNTQYAEIEEFWPDVSTDNTIMQFVSSFNYQFNQWILSSSFTFNDYKESWRLADESIGGGLFWQSQDKIYEFDLQRQFNELDLIWGATVIDNYQSRLDGTRFAETNWYSYINGIYTLTNYWNIFAGIQYNSPEFAESDTFARLGLTTEFDSGFGIKFILEQTFRQPSGAELSNTNPNALGNPNLMSESADSLNIQLSWMQQNHYLALTYYHSKQKEIIELNSNPLDSPLIDTVPTANRQYNNVGKQKLNGWELEGKGIFNQWQLDGSLVIAYSEKVDTGVKDFSLTPRVTGKLRTLYTPSEKLSLSLSYRYLSKYPSITKAFDGISTGNVIIDGTPSKPGHFIDFASTYQLTDAWLLQLKGTWSNGQPTPAMFTGATNFVIDMNRMELAIGDTF